MRKNLFLTAVSIFTRLASGMVLFVLLARLWGPESFGVFSFAFSASMILALIVEFGFAGYLLREIGANASQAPQLIGEALAAKLLVASVFVLAVMPLFVWAMIDFAPPDLLVPLLFAAILASFADFFIAPLRALGRYDRETYLVIGANLLHFSVCGAYAYGGAGLAELARIFVATRLIYLMVSYLVLRRTVDGLRLTLPARVRMRAALRRALPYGLDGALTTAYGQLDVIAVRLIFGAHTVGVYTAGQKLAQGAAMLAPVIGNVMVPALARATREKQDWNRLASSTRVGSMLVGLILAAPMILFSGPLTELLYGEQYSGLQGLLPLFGGLVFLRYLAASSGILLTAAGHQSKRVFGQVIAIMVFSVGAGVSYLAKADINWIVISQSIAAVILASYCWTQLSESKWHVSPSLGQQSILAIGVVLVLSSLAGRVWFPTGILDSLSNCLKESSLPVLDCARSSGSATPSR